MATTKLHSEAILRNLLAGSGIPALVRLAAESPVRFSADEMAAMPLDRFAHNSLIILVDSSLLGERIWFVSGESQVRSLLERAIPRGKIYTAEELLSLLRLPGMDAEKVKRLHAAKELFEGTLRGITSFEGSGEAEDVGAV